MEEREEALEALQAAAEACGSLAPNYVQYFYNEACAYALMMPLVPRAEQAAIGDRAMAALRRAVAGGYTDLRSFETDSDLDALRGRADFRALMTELPGKGTTNRSGRRGA
jgi:hypothetical protein